MEQVDFRFPRCRGQSGGSRTALRKQGVEAWEFHDRDCSFVTIGSFDSYGSQNADGTTEMEPEIYKLMEKYKGKIVDAKGNYEAQPISN